MSRLHHWFIVSNGVSEYDEKSTLVYREIGASRSIFLLM